MVPMDADFLDVDGVAVARLPSGKSIAFPSGKGADVPSYPYPNGGKVLRDGCELTREEFIDWLKTGKNKYDVS